MQKKKGAKHTKKVGVRESSSSEEESEYEDDNNEDDDDCEFTNIQEPKDITDAQKILHATWKSLTPPVKEDNLKGCYYAVIYIYPKNNKKMFVGKVLHRWLHDEQGSLEAITIGFFKKITLQISMMAYMKSLTKIVQIQILYQSIKLFEGSHFFLKCYTRSFVEATI